VKVIFEQIVGYMWHYQDDKKTVKFCTEITFITGAIPLSEKGSADE